MTDSERNEHYLSVIQRIVEQQKEVLGEKEAIRWARRAPLKIDADGNVTGFYGSGKDALEIVQEFIEHQEFYLSALQEIVDAFKPFIGKKMSVANAHRAPIDITPDGEVKAYYGRGRVAVEILRDQYQDRFGEAVANTKMKQALQSLPDENYYLLPEDIRPETDG